MERLWWQNKRIVALWAAAAMLLLLTVSTGASTVGGSSGAYLRPWAGAEAMAIAGANSALPEYLSPWWNPAAMSFHKGRVLSGGLGLRSLGRTDAFGNFEFKIPPRLGLGLMVLYRGDPFLNNLYDENENPLERASYTSLTGKIAFSYYINRKLSAGAAINIRFQQLPTNIEGNRMGYSSCTDIGSLDLAFVYQLNRLWTMAAVLKDVGASMNWTVNLNNGNSAQIEEKGLPSLTLASEYQGRFFDKPLIWTMDLKGYLFDGEFKILERPQGVFSTGFEWRNWEKFYIRAGLGELLINGDLLRDRDSYFSSFPIRITAGFSLDMQRLQNGLRLNYGVSTDKLWAGIDQQIDVQWNF